MQSFKNYLSSNKNLLIVWFSIHLFALFVNFFGIEGFSFNTKRCDKLTQHNLFTTNNVTTHEQWTISGSISEFNKERFWPFVTFFERGIGNPERYCVNPFYGIFVYYDYSEFIAYSVLIFLYLYIRFSSKEKPKKMQVLTIEQANCIAAKYQFLRFKGYANFTVEVVQPIATAIPNEYHVRVITKPNKNFKSNPYMLDTFCQENGIDFSIEDCL